MKAAVSRLCVCITFFLAAFLFQNLAYAQEQAKVEAQKAADQWLALVDAGKYRESWDAASSSFKSSVTRADWVKKAAAARNPTGRLLSRKLTKSTLVKNPPNLPPGQYVAIQYQSSFQNVKSAVETVVPMLDKDGKWRVTDYIVSKAG
jgi:hypothetical protein